MSITSHIGSVLSAGEDFVNQNIGSIETGAISAVVGLGVGGAAGYAIGKKSSKHRRKSKSKNIRKRNYRNSRSRKSRRAGSYARTAGKHRDTSKRRIRQTKKGQPYVILANGRARFIKKSSAHNSRKRSGGRY